VRTASGVGQAGVGILKTSGREGHSRIRRNVHQRHKIEEEDGRREITRTFAHSWQLRSGGAPHGLRAGGAEELVVFGESGREGKQGEHKRKYAPL